MAPRKLVAGSNQERAHLEDLSVALQDIAGNDPRPQPEASHRPQIPRNPLHSGPIVRPPDVLPGPSFHSRSSGTRRTAEPIPSPRNVPHYLSETTVKKDRLFRILYISSVLITIVYVAIRVAYIASGRVRVQVPEEVSRRERERVEAQNDSAVIYSIVVLLAEIGGAVLVHIGQQMFSRQKTKFTKMSSDNVERMKNVVREQGTLQRIHVIVCTYSEDPEIVERCVRALLASPLPVYAERTIYVADDGYMKPQGAFKREMVDMMREAGHSVVYVGDRVKRRSQLNGKSSNLNHVILNKIYPHAQCCANISWKDIIMVMDCDHLVEPEYFQKACSVMLDKDVAVCLVPQAFHNAIYPDIFDNTNTNFMFRLMPYYFGAGCCFITGTNVMVRARPCFEACQFDHRPNRNNDEMEANNAHRQLFSEVLVAEDVDLGSRIHALGYKSVFLDEVLAKGEVPHAPRDFWKQRSRWAKAAHLYVLDSHSVFWKRQPYMSFYQKHLYWIPVILHFTIFFVEPIMFTLPLVCICFGVCPYGIDVALWVSHIVRLAVTFLLSTHADRLYKRMAALNAQTSSRVLYFVNVKAVLNTVMIYFRFKRAGAFKVTAKGGGAKAQPAAPAAAGAWPVAEQNELNQEQLRRTSFSAFYAAEASKDLPSNDTVPEEYWGYADLYADIMESTAVASVVAAPVGASRMDPHTATVFNDSDGYQPRSPRKRAVQHTHNPPDARRDGQSSARQAGAVGEAYDSKHQEYSPTPYQYPRPSQHEPSGRSSAYQDPYYRQTPQPSAPPHPGSQYYPPHGHNRGREHSIQAATDAAHAAAAAARAASDAANELVALHHHRSSSPPELHQQPSRYPSSEPSRYPSGEPGRCPSGHMGPAGALPSGRPPRAMPQYPPQHHHQQQYSEPSESGPSSSTRSSPPAPHLKPQAAAAPAMVEDHVDQKCGLYPVHDGLSHYTEKRKSCMPFEGTLDFWVLFFITLINIVAMLYGLIDLSQLGSVFSLRGTEEQNVRLIAVVFALVEATPGLLFFWYVASYRCCRWTLWLWTPLLLFVVIFLVLLIEFRVGFQYVVTALGLNWELPDCDLHRCDVFKPSSV